MEAVEAIDLLVREGVDIGLDIGGIRAGGT